MLVIKNEERKLFKRGPFRPAQNAMTTGERWCVISVGRVATPLASIVGSVMKSGLSGDARSRMEATPTRQTESPSTEPQFGNDCAEAIGRL